MKEVINTTIEAITRSQRKCIQCVIGVSYSMVRKVCHDDLLLFLYKIQFIQPLSCVGIMQCNVFMDEFGVLLKENPDILNAT
jgi:hypothetical protein